MNPETAGLLATQLTLPPLIFWAKSHGWFKDLGTWVNSLGTVVTVMPVWWFTTAGNHTVEGGLGWMVACLMFAQGTSRAVKIGIDQEKRKRKGEGNGI